jgi:putative redox protein
MSEQVSGDQTNSAVAHWKGGMRCEVDAGGFSLDVDEPVMYGGTGAGPMPTDLLLASLSSCYALAIAWAAGKRGVELPDLEVTAIGTYDGPRFSSFELVVTTSLPAEQLQPLLGRASRVCYVSRTLEQPPTITVTTPRPD